jgi:hypothetical protein
MEIVFESIDRVKQSLISMMRIIELHSRQMYEIDKMYHNQHADRKQPINKQQIAWFFLT